MTERDIPAFEVRCAKTGHVWKIWASGEVDGFGSTGTIVTNRIPQIVGRALQEAEDARKS